MISRDLLKRSGSMYSIPQVLISLIKYKLTHLLTVLYISILAQPDLCARWATTQGLLF
ncbi:hypothetical protein HanRHA438_Chr05g0234201 [Helianthus annuus]|nr:hypothetical protein HanRHA438_Chr05g0234201 [Helianthus annuus]